MSYFLPLYLIQEYVNSALKEDIASGDITSQCFYQNSESIKAVMNSRVEGIVAGMDVVECVFKTLDKDISFTRLVEDGQSISKGQDIAVIEGNAIAVLSGERTALNFVQRMSAIATLTNNYQQAILPYAARIADTRKTTPNFRLFEKYSVKVGGGSPHRAGLYDCVMLKDNHIKIAGGIQNAIDLVRKQNSHTHKIEVECDTFEQVTQAVEAKADIIMLDNMSIQEMKLAVEYINKRAIVEASGTVTIESVNEIASTEVDIISTSAITARAGILDIGLDI